MPLTIELGKGVIPQHKNLLVFAVSQYYISDHKQCAKLLLMFIGSCLFLNMYNRMTYFNMEIFIIYGVENLLHPVEMNDFQIACQLIE